jgi:hypothetical protein
MFFLFFCLDILDDPGQKLFSPCNFEGCGNVSLKKVYSGRCEFHRIAVPSPSVEVPGDVDELPGMEGDVAPSGMELEAAPGEADVLMTGIEMEKEEVVVAASVLGESVIPQEESFEVTSFLPVPVALE